MCVCVCVCVCAYVCTHVFGGGEFGASIKLKDGIAGCVINALNQTTSIKSYNGLKQHLPRVMNNSREHLALPAVKEISGPAHRTW